MGLSARDLLDTTPTRPAVPTFAEYVPVVAAAVGNGTRRVYGSYWNRDNRQRSRMVGRLRARTPPGGGPRWPGNAAGQP